MTTATEEATAVRDAILVRVDDRATLNFKGAKAQKAYLHTHGGSTDKAQARGYDLQQFAVHMKSIPGVSVTVPKHLRKIAATKLAPISDQKLVPGEEFEWPVKVPEPKDDVAKAERDAHRAAAADSPVLLISPEMIEDDETLLLFEIPATGE